MFLDIASKGIGKALREQRRRYTRRLGSWWRDGYIYRSKRVPLKTKFQRVASHVLSTALNERGRELGRKRTSRTMHARWRKSGLPTMAEEERGEDLEDYDLGCF